MTPLPPQVLKFVELLKFYDQHPRAYSDDMKIFHADYSPTVSDLRATVKYLQERSTFNEGFAAGLKHYAEVLAQRDKSQGWQPISSAPRSGTILLWWRTCEPATGSWVEDCAGKEGWRCDGDACIPKNQQDCLYWHPLPEPPTQAAHDPYEFAESEEPPKKSHLDISFHRALEAAHDLIMKEAFRIFARTPGNSPEVERLVEISEAIKNLKP